MAQASEAIATESANDLVHYGIREARENISKLINRVENTPSLVATVGQREHPSVLVASFEWLKHILGPDLKSKIAFLIAENLLAEASLHIRNPQIEELSKLGMDDLVLLLQIKKLPLSKAKEKALKSQLKKPAALERLLKRHRIARAIDKAKKEGLYESAEHFSSQTDTGKEDDDETNRAHTVR